MSEPDFIEVLKGVMEQIKEDALEIRPAYLNSAAIVSKEEFEYVDSFPGLDSVISLRNGYRDADTGKECPSANSFVFIPKSALEDMLFVEDRGYELITMSDKTDFNDSGEPPDIVEMLKEHRDKALREAEKYPVGSIIYQQYQIAASLVDSIIGPVLTNDQT